MDESDKNDSKAGGLTVRLPAFVSVIETALTIVKEESYCYNMFAYNMQKHWAKWKYRCRYNIISTSYF